MKFDKKETLEHLKQVGRVIEYWKEGSTRKVLVEINGQVHKCVGVWGANQFQYKARIEGSSRELMICVTSNYAYEIEQAQVMPKVIRRRIA